MPLKPGRSNAVKSQNISEMMAAGHPQDQAVAAAMDNARRHPKAGGGSTDDEGFTVNEYGAAPSSGYMVSLPGHEKIIPRAVTTAADRAAYTRENQADLEQPGNYFGGWQHKGKTYLDVSRDVPTRTEAVREAHRGHQKAIYDVRHHHADLVRSVGGAINAALHVARKLAEGGGPGLSLTGAPGAGAADATYAGPLHTHGAGRTDRIKLDVKPGSYIVPADVVSILGQGNTLNGSAVLKAMFDPKMLTGGIQIPPGQAGKLKPPMPPTVAPVHAQSHGVQKQKMQSGGTPRYGFQEFLPPSQMREWPISKFSNVPASGEFEPTYNPMQDRPFPPKTPFTLTKAERVDNKRVKQKDPYVQVSHKSSIDEKPLGNVNGPFAVDNPAGENRDIPAPSAMVRVQTPMSMWLEPMMPSPEPEDQQMLNDEPLSDRPARFRTMKRGGAADKDEKEDKDDKKKRMHGLTALGSLMGYGPQPSAMGDVAGFGDARGGKTSKVPIVAAGGEHVVAPESIIAKFGKAGMDDRQALDHGHETMDEFVKLVRAEEVKRLKNAPPPKR